VGAPAEIRLLDHAKVQHKSRLSVIDAPEKGRAFRDRYGWLELEPAYRKGARNLRVGQ
jgi:hypothetical protein